MYLFSFRDGTVQYHAAKWVAVNDNDSDSQFIMDHDVSNDDWELDDEEVDILDSLTHPTVENVLQFL